MAESFNRMAGALQEQHGQLEQQAFTDSLTGIPNRALFEDRARHALNRTLRTSERIAVLMIDLDDFKLVNDGLGHASGDELIAAGGPADRRRDAPVGHRRPTRGGRVRGAARERPQPRRRPAPRPSASARLFDAPFNLNGEEVVVTTSIGIAMAQDSLDAEELLRRADLAMYRVKERGKDGKHLLRSRHGGSSRRPARRPQRTAEGPRAQRARGPLSADRQPRDRCGRGRRGADALGPARPRPGAAAGLHPVRGGDRADPADGCLDPQGGMHPGPRMARRTAAPRGSWSASTSPPGSSWIPTSSRSSARPIVDTGLEPHGLVLEVTESSVMQNPEVTIPEARPDRPERRAALARRLRRGLFVAQPSPAPARQRASRSPGRSSRGSPIPKPTRGSSAASSSWPTASGCTWWPRASRRPSSARRSSRSDVSWARASSSRGRSSCRRCVRSCASSRSLHQSPEG